VALLRDNLKVKLGSQFFLGYLVGGGQVLIVRDVDKFVVPVLVLDVEGGCHLVLEERCFYYRFQSFEGGRQGLYPLRLVFSLELEHNFFH
jgi:hypothetical protein